MGPGHSYPTPQADRPIASNRYTLVPTWQSCTNRVERAVRVETNAVPEPSDREANPESPKARFKKNLPACPVPSDRSMNSTLGMSVAIGPTSPSIWPRGSSGQCPTMAGEHQITPEYHIPETSGTSAQPTRVIRHLCGYLSKFLSISYGSSRRVVVSSADVTDSASTFG